MISSGRNLAKLDRRINELEPILRAYYPEEKEYATNIKKAGSNIYHGAHLVSMKGFECYYDGVRDGYTCIRFTSSVCYSGYKNEASLIIPNTPYINIPICVAGGLDKWTRLCDIVMVDFSAIKKILILESQKLESFVEACKENPTVIDLDGKKIVLNILNNYITIAIPELYKIENLILDELSYDGENVTGGYGSFPYFKGELMWNKFKLRPSRVPEVVQCFNLNRYKIVNVSGIAQASEHTGVSESSIKQVLSLRQFTARDKEGNRWVFMTANTQKSLDLDDDKKLGAYIKGLMKKRGIALENRTPQ